MNKMIFKVVILGVCMASGAASAATIGNAGAAQLQRDAVSLLAPSPISVQDNL